MKQGNYAYGLSKSKNNLNIRNSKGYNERYNEQCG